MRKISKKLNRTQKLAISVNVMVRVLLPLWIFINPWQGAIIALVTDCFDHLPLVRWLHVPDSIYQLQDKLLDYYWYVLVMIYALFNIKDQVVLILLMVSFLIRTVGQIVFTYSHKEKLLLYFPNIFEPIFWLWLIYPKYLTLQYMPVTIGIILVIKIANEYYTHVLKGDPWDLIKPLFGR